MVGGDETDLGFAFMGIQGIERLRDDYGWDISISRQVAYPDQHSVASDYGDAGYDVVFCVGGQFIETTYFDVATSYNDTLFVQIPGLNEYVPAPKNVVGLHPSFQAHGHYLAGVLAGQMTVTNRLGVVFGEWYEYLSIEFYAFQAGVESVNPNALVYCRVAGTWGDAAIGKQITETLIQTKNVDIVVQVADTTGRGVISACQDAGIAVIGTVADQYSLAPEITMTSIGMDTPLMMELVAQYVENGTAMSELGGLSWKLPIGNYLYPYHNYDDIIPQSVKDSVEDAKAGIADGSIEVPLTVTEEPPEDPEEPVIPGFPLMYLTLTSMLGIMFLLVNRSRRITNKHKS
jgi:basic membrane protein A